jgi:thiol-disulfide isomerase/thioredoxin
MRTIVAALLCAAALTAADASRRAPGFSLPDSKQQQHDLADYRGKVLILEFMQTGCAHCAAFNSVLSQVERKYGDRVAILGIVNPPSDIAKVNAYVLANKIAYPVVFDCGQVAYSYFRTGTFDVPHVFLIDANGAIREDFGYLDTTKDIFEGNGLFPHLDALLGKK